MTQRAPFVALLLLAMLAFSQGHGRLTMSRCGSPGTGHSTGFLRATLATPDSGEGLRVMLFRVEPEGATPTVTGGIDSVTNISPGLYRVRIPRIGYYPLQDTLRIRPGEAWCLTADMVRQPIHIERIILPIVP
jgi:hypothetical protein